MKKGAKEKHFIKKPIYEGGPKAMKKFVRENIKYPEEALEKKIEGSVYVKYDIDHKGKVIDAKVISGIGHGCDEEAIRLVKMFEFTVPKTPHKTRVVFHNNIHIHFRLPKEKKQAGMTVQYSPKKGSEDIIDKNGKPEKTYSYTISF